MSEVTDTDNAMAVPQLSIVIPNWNGQAVLPNCLESIACNLGTTNAEIIVFDNASTDNSVQIMTHYTDRFDLRIIQSQTNIGFAGACNRALATARAPFIFLLNNDAEITGGFEDALRFLIDHPEVAVCQGPLLAEDGQHIDSVGSLIARFGFLHHLHAGQPIVQIPESRNIFSVKGAAAFVRKSALGTLGLFDESAFAYFEESDLCWRLQVSGWDVMYLRDLPPVLHLGGFSAMRLSTDLCEYHSFKNRFRSILKNAEFKTLLTMVPLHAGITFAACVEGLVNGSFRRTVNVSRAAAWNVRNLKETLVLRKMVQNERRRSDRDIFAKAGIRMGIRDFLGWSAFMHQHSASGHNILGNATHQL